MFVVRYVALAALVVWLGGMIAVSTVLTPAAFDVLQAGDPQDAAAFVRDVLGRFDLVGYLCGGLLFVALFVMKFVGPPPAAFAPRAVIVAAMLASAAYSGVVVRPQIEAAGAHAGAPPAAAAALQQRATLLMTLNIALGSVLLLWYARE